MKVFGDITEGDFIFHVSYSHRTIRKIKIDEFTDYKDNIVKLIHHNTDYNTHVIPHIRDMLGQRNYIFKKNVNYQHMQGDTYTTSLEYIKLILFTYRYDKNKRGDVEDNFQTLLDNFLNRKYDIY